MRIVVVVAMAGLLGGCHQSEVAATLKDRAAKYWDLKQAKRWEEIYDGYLDPTRKSGLAKEAFLKRRLLAFDVLSYQIGETQEDGDTATLAVENDVNFPLRSPTGEMQLIKKHVTTKENWVRRDGIWYVQLTE